MDPNDHARPGRFRPSPEDLASTGNRTLEAAVSPDGTPQAGRRYTIPARQGLAVRVTTGQRVVVTNTHGTQVVDSWAFDAGDPTEFMSMEHVRAAIGRIVPAPPDALVTNKRRPILTFVEDTSPGVHDTLVAACDTWRYRNLGIEAYHDSCDDNLRLALRAIGLDAPEVPCPFNLFMNIPLGVGGTLAFEPTVSRPGDAVTFRAEMDVVYVVSACPMDRTPINGPAMTPMDAHLTVMD